MALKTICSEIMDLLDSADNANIASLEEKLSAYSGHLQSCRACRSYFGVTRSLMTGLEKEPEVDLWNKFLGGRQKPARKTFVLQVAGWAALTAGVVVIMVGLLTGPIQRFTGKNASNQSNIVASNNTESVPQVQYDYESTDLDYYYEISFKM